MLVRHLKDLLAAHLANHLRMVLLNVLFYVRHELIISLGLNVGSALAVNDLAHRLSFTGPEYSIAGQHISAVIGAAWFSRT